MDLDDLRKRKPEDVFFEPGSGLKNHRGTQRFRAFVKLFFLVKDKNYWGNEQKIEAVKLTLQYIRLRQSEVSFWKKEDGKYVKLDEDEKISKVKVTIDGYIKDRTKIDENAFDTDKDILPFYEKVKGEGNVQAIVTKVKELLMSNKDSTNLSAYDETMTGRACDDNQMSKRMKVIHHDKKRDLYEILGDHTSTKYAVVEKKDDSDEQEDEYRLDNFFLCDEEQNIDASTDIALVAKQARYPLGVSDDNFPLNRLLDRRREVLHSLSIQFMNTLKSFCQCKDEDTILPNILLTKQDFYSVRNSSIYDHRIWVEEKLNGNEESSIAVFKADCKSHLEGEFCSDLLKPHEETQLIQYEDLCLTPENFLHAFSYFSFLNGRFFLAEVKYVYFPPENLFKLTDPIIYNDGHFESFGRKDLGENGIIEYQKEHSRHCLNPICERLERHFHLPNISKTI